jgi:hypothetical protein
MGWAEAAIARQTGWAGAFAEALATVAGFLNLYGDDGRFDTDVVALVGPALPLLMHKRQKFFAHMEEPAKRWRAEIEFYVDRILWPMLGAGADRGGRIRTRVIGLVDALVTRAQARAATIEVPQPLAWRDGWAG